MKTPIKVIGIVLGAIVVIAIIGSTAGCNSKKAVNPAANAGCPQINNALNKVFDGSYANLPAAKTTGDLIDNFLGYDNNATSIMVGIMAEKGTSSALRSAESKLNNDVNTLSNTSYVSSAQTAVLMPDLKAISDICGSAAWTAVTLKVETGTPNGSPAPSSLAPSSPTPKAPYISLTDAGWAQIAKDPDGHAGETYKVHGKITQFDTATGTNAFRADVGGVRQYPDEFGLISYPTNTVLDGDSGVLEPYVQGDLFFAKVIVVGSLSYQTQIGGETTVPELQIVSIHKLGHVDN